MEKETTQCQIFRDTEKNKLIDSDPENIVTLGKYCPKYDRPYEEMDEFSRMILNIKKDERELDQNSKEYYYYEKVYYEEAVNYFTKQLHSILSDTKEYAICVYPTSKTCPAFTGMRTIVKRLCKYSVHRIDGSDVLLRKLDVTKKSTGGERDLQKEIKSLAVGNEDIIKGKQILLMDDITTTGTSLKDGKCVLEQKGAKIIALLALGKTV